MPRSTAPRPILVLLVRHGHTATTRKVLPGRAGRLHLDDAGRAQAQVVAERLAALKSIDAIYAPPPERTRETASGIATLRMFKVRMDKCHVRRGWDGVERATHRPERQPGAGSSIGHQCRHLPDGSTVRIVTGC